MPVETLRPSGGRLAGAPFTSAMPFRILNKGPDYFRRPAGPAVQKLSAVERLEADKAKYVKSQQVASTRQEPVKAPLIRKPLLSPGMLQQCRVQTPPTRKPLAARGAGLIGRRASPLNLDILNNLINVCDSPSSVSQERGFPLNAQVKTSLPQTDQNRRPPPVPSRPARIGTQGVTASPNVVTVRRVDVHPNATSRPLVPKRPQPQVAQPQAPPSSFQAPPSSQAPPSTPPPVQQSNPCTPSSPLNCRSPFPPASPAFTRLSSASSHGSVRKHPSLHRSKSDLSDRYSRATADLERFFNYCGLDPDEVDHMGAERFTRASSDIVSVSKLRSVSTPSSECDGAASRHSGQEADAEGPPNERAPYGISIIERNARVIKWLYGIRQARDAHSVSNV